MHVRQVFLSVLFTLLVGFFIASAPHAARAYVSPLNPPLDSQFRCTTNGGNGMDGGVPECSWAVKDWSGTPNLWAGYFLLRKQDGTQNQRNLICSKWGADCWVEVAGGSNTIVVNPGEPVWVEWSSEPYIQLRAYECGSYGCGNENGDLYKFMDHPSGGYNYLSVPGYAAYTDYWGGMWINAPSNTQEWWAGMGRVYVRAFFGSETVSYNMSMPVYVEAAVVPKSVSIWQNETAVNWDNPAGTVHYATTGYSTCTLYGSNGNVWAGYTTADWWTGYITADAYFSLYCWDSAGNQEGPWTLWLGMNPYGVQDAATCSIVGGWACDQSSAGTSIDVHVYADGAFIGAMTANGYRADVPASGNCNGTGNYHGYTMSIPESLRDGNTHQITTYAINYGLGNVNSALIGTPQSIQCSPSAPPPPTNLSLSCTAGSGGTGVDLSWSSAGGGTTGYYERLDYQLNNTASCTGGWYCGDGRDWLADLWGNTTLHLSISPSVPYNFWVHSANSAGTASDAIVTGAFYCPAPAPTPTYTCNAGGTSATISWSAVNGAADSYGVRFNDTTNDTGSCTWGWYCAGSNDYVSDGYTSNSISVTTVPGHVNSFWVYTIIGGNWSDSSGLTFTCNANLPSIGLVDSPTSAYTLTGYAYNPNNASLSSTVKFYVDGTYAGAAHMYAAALGVLAAAVSETGSAVANLVRSGLGVSGNHGWSWAVPSSYQTGSHIVHVYAVEPNGTLTELQNSPVTIPVCGANYAGVYPDCTCPSGYGGTYPSCTCPIGYTGTFPTCTPGVPTVNDLIIKTTAPVTTPDLALSPSVRVKAGTTVSISWSAQSAAACSVTATGQGTLASCSSYATCSTPHTLTSIPIVSPTVYTLSCSPVSKQLQVNLIPKTQEI